jgi:hypothetical protein
MNFLKYAAAFGLTLALAACGGGGGNAGTPSGGTGSSGNSTGTGTGTGTVAVATPTMTLSFVDSSGVAISSHVLSQTQTQFLKVVLVDALGGAVPFGRVTIALDSTDAVMVPVSGTQLTDQSGTALLRISPASVNSSGTVRATASATVGATALSKSYDLQINAGTVGLSAVSVTPATLQKGQAVNVSVNVTVNGAAAPSNSVAVVFNTACGTVSPASALVDATGKASAVIQTTNSGNCSVDASVSGVTSSPTSYTVTSAPTTGIQFVSAAPSLLYQSGSAGATTSIVSFKVIDSVAAGVQGVTVNASFTNTDGGINFCGSPASGTSGADGTVTFSVCSGTLPATVQVRAQLASNAAIFTNSNLLTIQTGLPTQRFFDISATQLNIYAGGYFTTQFNGNTTTISVFAADRQGNPVPDGTKIVFVSEGGQINSAGVSSCLIANGRCSVDLIGQDYRPMGSTALGGDPRPGRVTVLAYTDGEESFVDANYNNRYDAGELFEDLGALYLDKDENGKFVASYKNLITGTDEGEFMYPMPAGSTGTSACPTNSNVGLSVAGTCNGVWDGYTKVRRGIVIIFSGGEIGQPGSYDASIPVGKHTQTISATTSAISVQLADYDGNPLPASASVTTEVLPSGGTCKATLLGSQIGSATEPTGHTALLDKCMGGELVLFKVSVTAGSGTVTSSYGVTVPTPTPDTTPPTLTAGPTVESITSTGALLSAKIDEAGTGYFKVQLATDVAPSAFAVAFQGTAIGMAANVVAGASLSSLTAATNYTVYFVAKDAAGNIQSTVSSVSFTTSP